ncbi:MAG TPA: capsule biosynthesis protein, partial [Caulobacteraceae bacterium]
VLRYYTRGDLDGVARGEEVLRRYLEAAILSVRAYRRLLGQQHYDVALFHHGLYVPQGLVGEVCREAGMRVVNWVVAYRSNSFILSEGDTYHHTLMTEPVSAWRDMAWGERQKGEIAAYLKSRWRGERDWIGFHEKPEEDAAALVASLGLDLSKPIVGMLSNVVWDAQLHYPANAFPSLIDWAVRTIDYFAGRPELQLLLRIHPAEVRGTSPSRQPLLAEIRRRFPELPPNVFIIPAESPVSTYAAMELCDSVLIYGTKTGVELTAVGIPVVVAGEAWIKNKGLTLDASTPDDYVRILDSLPLRQRLAPEVMEQAQKYAYHFFFRRMMPLPLLEKVSSNLFFTPNIDSADDLAEGQSPALDILCEAILTGRPFIYPAERLGVHDLP